MDVAPNAAEMQQKVRAVAAYVASGKEARAAIDAQLRPIIAQFKEDALTKSAPYLNHWLCANTGGNYGANYRNSRRRVLPPSASIRPLNSKNYSA
jgi:hypothetical protein